MNTDTAYATVQGKLRDAKTKNEFERVLCVWLKLSLSLNSRQIAKAIGWTDASVRRLQARYAKEGVDCFTGKPTGGRKRENISRERETKILDKFARQAKRGTPLDVKEIKNAYERSAGKTVAWSTIYRLISRHGLRRFLPRAASKTNMF
jgi:transposase